MSIDNINKLYRKFDINLLPLFVLLFECGSVSQTASRLGVSASAVSQSLNKLRGYFFDPLFVRDCQTMIPTDTARHLYFLVHDDMVKLIEDIDQLLDANAIKKLVIRCSDYLCVRLFSDISDVVMSQHPKYQVIHDPAFERPESAMSFSGMTEVILGFTPCQDSSYENVKIMDEELCYICSDNHPRVADILTEENFQNEEYIVFYRIKNKEDEIEGFIPKSRFFSLLEYNSFITLLKTVENSECICIIPKWVLDHFKEIFSIKCIDSVQKLLPLPVYLSYQKSMASDQTIKDILRHFSTQAFAGVL